MAVVTRVLMPERRVSAGTFTLSIVAYDEELAQRVRDLVAEHGVSEEKRMFGGLAFMLGGHMAACVSGQGGLLLRVGEDALPGLLGEHVAPMVMGGRESRTWVRVAPEALRTEAQLETWVARGVAGAVTD
jgi:TfoX/Sxy family transcriptional regulator of competence genes